MIAETDPSLVAVLVAAISALGLILVAMVPIMWSTRRHAKEANEAVNCRPKGSPKIADEVTMIAREVKALARDVREVRKEQAAVAVALGKHLADEDG